MAYVVSGKTKKINTYGKKKQRIVPIQHKTVPSTPSQRSAPSASTSTLLLASLLSPVKTERPPLQTRTNAPPTLRTKSSSSSIDSDNTVQIVTSKVSKPARRHDRPIIIHESSSESEHESPKRAKSVKRLAKDKENVLKRQPSSDSVVTVKFVQDGPLTSLQNKVERLDLHQSIVKSPSLPFPSDSKLPVKANIKALLHACGQDRPFDFTSFHATAALSGLFDDHHSHDKWVKLGEATYSEVFYLGTAESDRLVVKIIPLYQPLDKKKNKTSDSVDFPEVSKIEDACRELEITRLLSEGGSTSGFIQLYGAFVVQGMYPQPLLREWDTFLRNNPAKAFNPRPSAFTASQSYLLLCLPYNGVDLESFKVQSWTQAASILWQIANSLEMAEREFEFEHRDLHWGNVLVKHVPIDEAPAVNRTETFQMNPLRRSAGEDWPKRLEPERSGVQVCIIDYTLSSARNAIDSTRLYGGCDEEELFQGQGDIQYQVYRDMREETKEDWASYHPITNLMWLHYLAVKLLEDKGLKRPDAQTRAKRLRNSLSPKRPRQQGRPRINEGRLDRQEMHSYEALKMAAETLAEVLTRRLHGGQRTSEEEDDLSLCWENCSDFTTWWEHSAIFR